MNKKLLILSSVSLIILGVSGSYIYKNYLDSKFTHSDYVTELEKSKNADVYMQEIVKFIDNIPDKESTTFLTGEKSNIDEECFYSGINKKAGYKSRFCEKKVIAYVGVSKENINNVTEYIKNIQATQNIPIVKELTDKTVDRAFNNASYNSGRSFKIKYQTKDKNDFGSNAPEELQISDYVIDIYYYDKYSQITRPLAIFEYL